MSAYLLSFVLPPDIIAAPGRHSPCLHGCVLVITRLGQVEIEGPSRERVFDQAARFMRVHGRDRPARTIGVTVTYPHAIDPARRGVRETWHMAIGADVSFSATPIAPYVPAAQLALTMAVEPADKSRSPAESACASS